MNSTQNESGQHFSTWHSHGPLRETMRILSVDDDPELQANMREILQADGYEIELAVTLREVLGRKDWAEFAAVLLDRVLPDGCTDDVLSEIREIAPETAVIVITGYKDADAAIAAVQHGAADYLIKPIEPHALRGKLRRVVENRHLRQRLIQLAAIVESSDDAIIGTTLGGVITSWNAGAARIYGYFAEEAVGRSVTFLVPGELSDEPLQFLGRIQQGSRVEHYETVRLRSDGQPIHVSISISPVRDSQGSIVGASSIARDITKQKQLERQLRESERMVALGQMVSVLAHVGRNALQRIYLRLELLAPQLAGQAESLKDLKRIELACDDLYKLQEDVLMFSAPIKLNRVHCSLAEVWQRAWSGLAPLWSARDATLEKRTNDVDIVCCVDPSQFEVVFRNLFENSLSECPDPVRITIRCQDAETEDGQALQVFVSDNGPGLTASQQAHVFEPFFTTKISATGLGLASARRIVEAHQGLISLGKGVDRGAEFLITLPRESPLAESV